MADLKLVLHVFKWIYFECQTIIKGGCKVLRRERKSSEFSHILQNYDCSVQTIYSVFALETCHTWKPVTSIKADHSLKHPPFRLKECESLIIMR